MAHILLLPIPTLGCFFYYRVKVKGKFHPITGHKGPEVEYPAFNPYPTAFPYGNGMVLHFYQQQESSTTKTVHKVINRGLKAYV